MNLHQVLKRAKRRWGAGRCARWRETWLGGTSEPRAADRQAGKEMKRGEKDPSIASMGPHFKFLRLSKVGCIVSSSTDLYKSLGPTHAQTIGDRKAQDGW